MPATPPPSSARCSSALEEEFDKLKSRFSVDVQKVAFKFAKAILDVEFVAKPDRVADLVAMVLKPARLYNKITVHLHPGDVDRVRNSTTSSSSAWSSPTRSSSPPTSTFNFTASASKPKWAATGIHRHPDPPPPEPPLPRSQNRPLRNSTRRRPPMSTLRESLEESLLGVPSLDEAPGTFEGVERRGYVTAVTGTVIAPPSPTSASARSAELNAPV